MAKRKTPWVLPPDSPVIEQSIHDYIVSIFRRLTGPESEVEIIPISPGAETTRGWDAAVCRAVPLYFQYKYPDFTIRPKTSQSEAYILRKKWDFDDSDGVFHFNLRKKARNAHKSQHALMVDLQNAGESIFYVSPTFIEPQRLRTGGKPIDETTAFIYREMIFHSDGFFSCLPQPDFLGLICIPPQIYVSDPPEAHKIVFNTKHEVSLHSEPTVLHSISLQRVINNQIESLFSDQAKTSDNIEEYVGKVIEYMQKEFHDDNALFEYFKSCLSNSKTAPENPLMRNLRALARMLRELYGIEMLLTIQK